MLFRRSSDSLLAHSTFTQPMPARPTPTHPTLAQPTLAQPTLAQPTLAQPTPTARAGMRVGVGRRRALGALLVAAVGVLPGVAVTSSPASAATSYVVAPWGSDGASGTAKKPFRTMRKGMSMLRAGGTLVVRGGTYAERIKLSPAKGTASRRITVTNAPGERPVVKGLLWLKGADYWTLRGINVTWSAANDAGEHMVKMSGGVGWRITRAEIWGARSYAAVLVAGAPRGWVIDHCWIHNTARTHARNQDHLVYVNAGMGAGLIERNTLSRSPNGRGVKVGPSSPSRTPIGNLVIRYNTFYDNRGPSNIQLSYGATKVRIYRNVFVRSGVYTSNVTAHRLNGTGNVVKDNVGWLSPRVADRAPGLWNAGGNVIANPYIGPGYRVTSGRLAAYGRYAP